jgi:hypothetical protein
MGSNYHYGDSVTNTNYGSQNVQFGPNSHMRVTNSQGSADTTAALREMVMLIQELRAQVTPADRQALDESASVLRQGERAEPGVLRRAVGTVIGIATLAGSVGGPALDAALKVKELLGL